MNNFGPPPLNHILYENLSQDWISWIGKEAAYSLAEKGYFSLRFPPKVSNGNTLKVISLQTNYCNNLAFFLYLNDTDPGKQLEWLISELQDSGKKREETRKTFLIVLYFFFKKRIEKMKAFGFLDIFHLQIRIAGIRTVKISLKSSTGFFVADKNFFVLIDF